MDTSWARAAGAAAIVAAMPAVGQITYGDFLGDDPLAGDVDYIAVSEASPSDPGAVLFGAPTRVGNALLFFPNEFAADAQDGSSDVTTGVLSLTVRAADGFFLDIVQIREVGDWQLTGVGTSATSVDVDGSLFVQDVTPGTNGVLVDDTFTTPVTPITLPADSGTFTSETVIDLIGLDVSEINLSFTSTLAATSEPGTTAFIQKTVIQGPVLEISVVPGPGSAAVLALAGAATLRRRR